MEFLVELLIEVVAQLSFELLGESAAHSLGRRRSTNRWAAYLGCMSLGGLAGMLATAVLPEPLLGREITGLNVLVSPLITASLMHLLGRWLRGRDSEPGTLTSFSGAWIFATAFSFTRFWILTHWIALS